MAGVNKVILIGRLGTDPETKSFENGRIVKFPLATSERFVGKDGNQQELTEWHNIVIRFDRLASLAEQYLRKGSQIYLEGRIRTRSWDDQSGNKRYMTEIQMDKMQFLGKAEGGSSMPSDQPAPAQNQVNEPQAPSLDDIDDDLPF